MAMKRGADGNIIGDNSSSSNLELMREPSA